MFHCHVCGSTESSEKLVNNTFDINDKLIVIENIPAEVCERCGDKTFSLETAEKVRLIAQQKLKPLKTIEVEVFAY
jgi:HTH-type transcriptional regulator / antitoxin MqsA